MASKASGPHLDAPVAMSYSDVASGKEQIPAGIVGADCSQSYFFVPAEWPGRKDAVVAEMYVEHLAPGTVEHEEPIVLIHGDFHSGDVSLEEHKDTLEDEILTCLNRYGSQSPILGRAGPRILSTEAIAYTLSTCPAVAYLNCLLPLSCLANCCQRRSI